MASKKLPSTRQSFEKKSLSHFPSSISNSGTQRQTLVLVATIQEPEGFVLQVTTSDQTDFLLLCDVGQYYNKKNSVLFKLHTIHVSRQHQADLHRDVSARRQGLCQATQVCII